jgi:hypothetical protein
MFHTQFPVLKLRPKRKTVHDHRALPRPVLLTPRGGSASRRRYGTAAGSPTYYPPVDRPHYAAVARPHNTV